MRVLNAIAAPRSREPSALNLLGIRYAKGQGVKRNLGTLYELGAMRRSDFQRAYAWTRAALSFGLPEEDHDETLMRLWMIAARIVETCKCYPGREPELASIDFISAGAATALEPDAVNTVIVPIVNSIAIGNRRPVQSIAAFFAALGYHVRIGVLAGSDLMERRFAEFARVPYHDPPSRQQWQELWDVEP
jgi:hypothetical protein